MKKLIAMLLAVVMVFALCACGSSASTTTASTTTTETAAAPAEEEAAPAEEAAAEEGADPASIVDTITIMVPPVSSDYVDLLNGWIADFNATYPNITIEVIETSWDDHNSKLSTMALAGEAPDIAEVSYSSIGSYVEMGVAVDIAQYMDLSDYDQNALDYMSLENTVYGLPLYLTIQALGGNVEMLEAAGVDVEKVQNEGWTYDEFLAAIAAGTTEGTYGFVFANAGATTSDFVNIFGVSAGINNAFTEDLKYAFTSQNMLNLLTAVEDMTASGYMPNYAVEAGQRMNMLYTGSTMITGKAMPLFEGSVNKNNAGIADGTAVEGSIEVEYAFLPVPAMDGVTASCFGSVDGMIVLRNGNYSDEHEANVCLFLDYICSGERIAAVDNELYLTCVCGSGRDAQAAMELDQSEGNAASTARCISLVVAPPAGITAEQSSNANTLMTETIVPKFQALLAGETTAQAMYDEICSAAFAIFGEENCETGFIG